MNYCGIILAKKDSERLPNKNFLPLLDDWSSTDCVEETLFETLKGNTYVFTDNDGYFMNHSVSRPS